MALNKRVLAVAAGLAGLLSLAGVAWACTATTFITASPHIGAAGTLVRVDGSPFGVGPVEIRWNSATGPVLGTGAGPTFSASVNIPAGFAPDIYYLVAVQQGNNGQITAKASAPFELTVAPRANTAGPAGTQFGGTAPDSEGFIAPAPPASTGAQARTQARLQAQGRASSPSTTVAGDLWSGLASRSSASSSLSSADPYSQARSNGPGLGAGLALLAVGVAGLGLGTVLASKRRATRSGG